MEYTDVILRSGQQNYHGPSSVWISPQTSTQTCTDRIPDHIVNPPSRMRHGPTYGTAYRKLVHSGPSPVGDDEKSAVPGTEPRGTLRNGVGSAVLEERPRPITAESGSQRVN